MSGRLAEPDRMDARLETRGPANGLGRGGGFRSGRYLPDVLFALLCAIALYTGIRAASGGGSWPTDLDNARDLAHAQAIRDGDLFADPAYRGEFRWFNPLVPALVALVSWVGGLTVVDAFRHVGVYGQVLSPVCLYLLTATLMGRWCALASAAGYFFVVGGAFPSWVTATYSPWLFPSTFAQAIFFLGVLLLSKTLDAPPRQTWLKSHVLLGVLLGLTFLAHTAPAILLGMIALTGMADRIRRLWDDDLTSHDIPRVVLTGIATFVTAAIVASPYLVTILGHYRLHLVHPAPAMFIDEAVTISGIGEFLDRNISPRSGTVLALLGLGGMALMRTRRNARLLLLTWIVGAASLLAYGYISQILGAMGGALPLLVPPHHWFIYLNAIKSIAFGYGTVLAARLLTRMLQAVYSRSNATRLECIGVVSMVSISCALAWPDYISRLDFTEVHEGFVNMAVSRKGWKDAHDWLRHNASAGNDVILARDEPALWISATANRRTVVVPKYHSSPYVNWERRFSDMELMFRLIAEERATDFALLAADYGVTYVVTQRDDPALMQHTPSFLRRVFTSESITIHQYQPQPLRSMRLGPLEHVGTMTTEIDGQIRVYVYIRCLATPRFDYTMWFHAVESASGAIAYFDHVLEPPTTTWQVGRLYRDDIAIAVPAGNYRFNFGFYVPGDEESRLNDGEGKDLVQAGPVAVP